MKSLPAWVCCRLVDRTHCPSASDPTKKSRPSPKRIPITKTHWSVQPPVERKKNVIASARVNTRWLAGITGITWSLVSPARSETDTNRNPRARSSWITRGNASTVAERSPPASCNRTTSPRVSGFLSPARSSVRLTIWSAVTPGTQSFGSIRTPTMIYPRFCATIAGSTSCGLSASASPK